MIRIVKGDCPEGLKVNGERLTKKDKIAYEKDPGAYAAKGFNISNAYKTAEVKEALLARQYNKCCFTEAKFVKDRFDVEHFRPKGAITPWPKGTGVRFYPGYYWLAYDWSNLFLSKVIPNQHDKIDYFPLLDESKRNRCHLDNHVEEPLLVHPVDDDPREHIGFEGDEICGKTDRGRATIEILRLREGDGIEEARRTHFNKLRNVLDLFLLRLEVFGADSEKVSESIREIHDAQSPQAEFSSMAIDFFQANPLPWSILHNPQNPAAAPTQPESPPSDQP